MAEISLNVDEVRALLVGQPKEELNCVLARLSQWLDTQASEPSEEELRQMHEDYGCGPGGLTCKDIAAHQSIIKSDD